MTKSKKIFLSVFVLFLGYLIGFVAGATYGGNVTCPGTTECSFRIFSYYGYEATGLIGSVIGVIVAALVLYYLLFRKGRVK